MLIKAPHLTMRLCVSVTGRSLPDLDDEFPVEGFNDLQERIEREVVRFGLLQLRNEGLAHLQALRQGSLREALPLPERDQSVHQPQLVQLLLVTLTEARLLEECLENLLVRR